jgi:hypothetical protein
MDRVEKAMDRTRFAAVRTYNHWWGYNFSRV